MPEISSREFAAEPLKVKQLAQDGPVVVTNRGRPELVILRYDRWRALVPNDVPEDLAEALADEFAGDLDSSYRGWSWSRARSISTTDEVPAGHQCRFRIAQGPPGGPRRAGLAQAGEDQPVVLERNHPPGLSLGIALKARKDEDAGRLLRHWYQRRLKPAFAGRILAVDEAVAERAADIPGRAHPIGQRRADRRHGPGPRSCAGDAQPARLRRDRRAADGRSLGAAGIGAKAEPSHGRSGHAPTPAPPKPAGRLLILRRCAGRACRGAAEPDAHLGRADQADLGTAEQAVEFKMRKRASPAAGIPW